MSSPIVRCAARRYRAHLSVPRDSPPRDSVPRDSVPRDSVPRDSVPRASASGHLPIPIFPSRARQQADIAQSHYRLSARFHTTRFPTARFRTARVSKRTPSTSPLTRPLRLVPDILSRHPPITRYLQQHRLIRLEDQRRSHGLPPRVYLDRYRHRLVRPRLPV